MLVAHVSRKQELQPAKHLLWKAAVLYGRCMLKSNNIKLEERKKVKVIVAQLHLTLCNPMNFTIHAILQARILEWVAVPFSRRSSQPRSLALQVDSLPAELLGRPKLEEGYPDWQAIPVALVVKKLPANARDVGDTSLTPGWGKCPGGEHGRPLQYSCLENPMDRGDLWATVHEVTKRWTQLKRLSAYASHVVYGA